jgi:DNA replication protein DnaC
MSAEKPDLLLGHYLKQLKLRSMLREYGKLADLCRDEGADYRTCLLRLVEREVLDRETRAAERRTKAARFPVIKTLDTFDFTARPSINQALVRELMTGKSAGHRRAGLRPVFEFGGGTAFRGHQPCLRAHQPDPDHQPAV